MLRVQVSFSPNGSYILYFYLNLQDGFLILWLGLIFCLTAVFIQSSSNVNLPRLPGFIPNSLFQEPEDPENEKKWLKIIIFVYSVIITSFIIFSYYSNISVSSGVSFYSN